MSAMVIDRGSQSKAYWQKSQQLAGGLEKWLVTLVHHRIHHSLDITVKLYKADALRCKLSWEVS